MAGTERQAQHGGTASAARHVPKTAEPQPEPKPRLMHRVIDAAARGPGHRPDAVLFIAVAVETVFLAALGTVGQTRYILGIPSSLMALTAVGAGAAGGAAVGCAAAVIGAIVYYATVAGFGSRGELLATLVSATVWVAAALIAAFLSQALRRQAEHRREAAVALARAETAQRAEDEVTRLHEALELQLVPPARIERSDLEVITRYLPSEGRLRLGGDFLDVMSLPRQGLALIIGDVSGHGPTAAALGATLRATWQGLVMSGADRATVRATLDATMVRERRDEDAFATACLAWIDRVGGWDRLHVLNIAHPLPLLLTDAVQPLAASPSLPMGVGGEARWEPVIVTLTPPWTLVFYTDGLVEGRAAPGSSDRVGEEGLAALLSRHGPMDETAVDELLAQVVSANDGPMSDDVALVVVSRRA